MKRKSVSSVAEYLSRCVCKIATYQKVIFHTISNVIAFQSCYYIHFPENEE